MIFFYSRVVFNILVGACYRRNVFGRWKKFWPVLLTKLNYLISKFVTIKMVLEGGTRKGYNI